MYQETIKFKGGDDVLLRVRVIQHGPIISETCAGQRRNFQVHDDGRSTSWVLGSPDLVDPGEQVDMTVKLTNLSPLLPKSREFTIQVKPNKGAVVIVNRTTPPELKAIMELN